MSISECCGFSNVSANTAAAIFRENVFFRGYRKRRQQVASGM
jgi:hypothetical protein